MPATIVKLYVELMSTLERAEPLKVVAPPAQGAALPDGPPLRNSQIPPTAVPATAIKDFPRR